MTIIPNLEFAIAGDFKVRASSMKAISKTQYRCKKLETTPAIRNKYFFWKK